MKVNYHSRSSITEASLFLPLSPASSFLSFPPPLPYPFPPFLPSPPSSLPFSFLSSSSLLPLFPFSFLPILSFIPFSSSSPLHFSPSFLSFTPLPHSLPSSWVYVPVCLCRCALEPTHLHSHDYACTWRTVGCPLFAAHIIMITIIETGFLTDPEASF